MKPIYTLKIGKSKKLLEGYSERYNQGKPSVMRLKGMHILLAEKLFYYYSKHIGKVQGHGNTVQKGTDLPELRTNRAQLSKKLMCSEKTVYNLIQRLMAAKIIIDKVSHGSNSSFGLKFNPAVLHISSNIDPTNQVLYFNDQYRPQASAATDSGSSFFGGSEKNLPHTVTSTFQELKKEIKEKVANVDKPHSTGKDMNKEAASSRDENPYTGYTANKSNSPKDATGTPPQVAAVPPAGYETIAESAAHLSTANQKRLETRVQIIWDVAFRKFYKHFYLVDREVERAKARIAEYFVYSDPKRWDAGAQEIITRLGLVEKWQKKSAEAKDRNTWSFPLPSTYFDIRNQKGFMATKSWYKRHTAYRAEVNKQIILTKAVQKYLRSLNDNSKTSPTEAYRQICQHLGKQSKNLVNQFNEKIAAHEYEA